MHNVNQMAPWHADEARKRYLAQDAKAQRKKRSALATATNAFFFTLRLCFCASFFY